MNPLAKENLCLGRGGKSCYTFSIEGFLRLANCSGKLDGIEIEFFDTEGKGSEVWVSPKPPAAYVARGHTENTAAVRSVLRAALMHTPRIPLYGRSFLR